MSNAHLAYLKMPSLDYDMQTDSGERGWTGTWFQHTEEESMTAKDTPLLKQHITETSCFFSLSVPKGLTRIYSLKLEGVKQAQKDGWEQEADKLTGLIEKDQSMIAASLSRRVFIRVWCVCPLTPFLGLGQATDDRIWQHVARAARRAAQPREYAAHAGGAVLCARGAGLLGGDVGELGEAR